MTNKYGLKDHLQLSSAFKVLNNAPTITVMDVSPDQALRNGSCDLRVYCSDTEDPLANMTAHMRYSLDSVNWAVITNITRFAGGFRGKAEFSTSGSVGKVYFKAKVCDSDGAWSSDTYLNDSFIITNQRPTVDSITVSTNMLYRGERVDVTVSCSDLETLRSELNLTLEYRSGQQWTALPASYMVGEGVFQTNLLIGTDFELRPLSFRAVSQDHDGALSTMRYLNDSVLVRNNPPQVLGFSTDKASVPRGENLDITMVCKDFEDPISLLIAECEYRVGNVTAWTSIAPLNRTSGGFTSNLKVPTGTPVGDMQFRARAFDEETYGIVNQEWYFPAYRVKVTNNAPVLSAAIFPSEVTVKTNVSIDIIVNASDIEDPELSVMVKWSMEGSGLSGSAVLSAVSKGRYAGKVTFDLPAGAGPFYVSYTFLAVDKEGGSTTKQFAKATKVVPDGSTGDDDDADDVDDGRGLWGLYAVLGVIIIVLVILIVVALVYVSRRRRDDKEKDANPPTPDGRTKPARAGAGDTQPRAQHTTAPAIHHGATGQPAHKKGPVVSSKPPPKPHGDKELAPYESPAPVAPELTPAETEEAETDLEGSEGLPEMEPPKTEPEFPEGGEEVIDELDELVDFDEDGPEPARDDNEARD